MADFRKWLLVLAVVALVAVPAGAQTCNLSPGNPTNIRDGGLTELTGDLVISCSGGTTATTVNLQVFMQGATVSNRVRAGNGVLVNGTPLCPFASLPNCVTDAMVLINDNTSFTTPQSPIIGLLQPAVSGTDSPTNRNSVLFPGIIIPAGTTVTQIRVTNIRVVAPGISTIALGVPTTVVESVSFLPQIPISPAFQIVANVLPAMQYTTTLCSDAGKSGDASFKQCVSNNGGLASSDSGTGGLTFNAKFTEGFPLAFKNRGDATLNVPAGTSQINLYESGLVLTPPSGSTSAFDGSTATGLADAGTKLRVNFKNIPQGVKIFVTQTAVDLVNGTTPLFLGAGTRPDPASMAGLTVSGTASCGSTSYALMKLTSDNAAVWEIMATGIANTASRSVSFGVAVAFNANTTAQLPALTGSTPMTTTGQLWPASTVAQASSSSSDKIPRFRDVQIASGNVGIGPCATTLLYPFTTNKAGFETGIAVINTSLDNYNSTKAPLNTSTQTGNCLVYFFDGSTSAPAPVDTGSIAPGAEYVNTVSGLAKGAAFQGYLIAKCNFQFGHGYAYIADTSAANLGAQGYLALVIPDAGSARSPIPFSQQPTSPFVGEMLAF